MASRLYSNTRPLYAQVVYCLTLLGIATLGSPTLAALIALYVTGLILLDVRQTQTRVTRHLPGRCHDALNRLLPLMPLSTRALMRLLVAFAKGLPFDYIVFDTHYTAGWFTKMISRLGYTWVGTLDPKTMVVWRGRRQSVRELAQRLRLKWRDRLQVRAIALRVYAPTYGHLRLVVTRNRHGNYEYIVSNDLRGDLTTLVERKRSRWSIETIFRDTKQYAGLEACQCWADQAWVRHVGLVLPPLSCCRSCGPGRMRVWRPSKNAGSWQPSSEAKRLRCRLGLVPLISGRPRKSCYLSERYPCSVR